MKRIELVLMIAGLGAACGPGEGTATEAAAASAPAPDAFCAEHGVAEAVCTLCNPRLAPIFQEKGDWCAEHGLPESFCPICRPELGGRPAAELGTGPPATGTMVRLAAPGIAEDAGIEVVEARADEGSHELAVVGTIAFDPRRQAEVNARTRGVVREILVELGERVEAGAPLVRIESAEIGAEQSRLVAASSRIELARAALARIETLAEKGMAAEKQRLEARHELDSALAEHAAAQAALGVVGVEAGAGSGYVLVAPIAGTCLELDATIGRLVEPGSVLCEITDASRVWAVLDVPERELGRVEAGREVVVRADALGEREFRGRIDHIVPEIDPHTRTAKARVAIENPDGALRANQFVRARIALGPRHARVLVPREALQRAEDVELVFVEVEPGSYETRRVRGAVLRDGMVALESGVSPGERVVAAGSFLLKTETLKGEIGAGCCAEE